MKFFAIKDTKSGLFYNRVHRDIRKFAQNTAFYISWNSANLEILFISEKILRAEAIKLGYCKKNDYSKLRDHYMKYINSIELVIVPIDIKEVK